MDRNNPRKKDIDMLLKLRDFPQGITVNKLAATHILSKVSISKKYQRLSKEGYVTLTKHGQERIMQLSDAGKSLVDNDILPFRNWSRNHSELFRSFVGQSKESGTKVDRNDVLSSLQKGTFQLLRFLITMGQGALTRSSFLLFMLDEGIAQIRREFEYLQRHPDRLKELAELARERFPAIADLTKASDWESVLNELTRV